MYTIWKARCDWTIAKEADPENVPTEKIMIGRIKATLTRHIKLDCLATDNKRFGKMTIKPGTVKSMWQSFLPDKATPVRAWRKAAAVLVGIG
ncbi:hypothetical protein J132_04021 [Termitomyces sp. J132]|nr:hypothetical protein J132_04021 [Termitomyces sp. J132]